MKTFKGGQIFFAHQNAPRWREQKDVAQPTRKERFSAEVNGIEVKLGNEKDNSELRIIAIYRHSRS